MMLLDSVDLLVMSVYNRASLPWMPLQKQFLDSTTKAFKLAVFLNHVESHELLDGIQVVGTNHESDDGPKEHLRGIKALLRYAKASTHQHFLILDSDCFPIAANWQTVLNPYLATYDNASVVRAENCTVFPHPCVCYFDDPTKVDFEIRDHRDLKGDALWDTTCISNRSFPLLRTNRRNRHLLAAAVYFDLFYHHGCGSRQFYMRGLDYYTNLIIENEDPDRLREELFANPTKFLETLTC